jgi:hypothetical protein
VWGDALSTFPSPGDIARLQASNGAIPVFATAKWPSREQSATILRLMPSRAAQLPGGSVSESKLPSASLNQAIFAPEGAAHTPNASWLRNAYLSNSTPRLRRAVIASRIDETDQPSSV